MTRAKAAFAPTFTRAMYTVPEWAEACGIGETRVREHIADGNLVPSYLDPVESGKRRTMYIPLEEGLRWIRTLPTE